MPSLVPGFEYDIFISYRQKDNKYDGWVTEFVSNLKKELEATFKEDISIYFDENPHDGLAETHNVDKSLDRKLNCLVFIPILSRTYCDPSSYAWKSEFIAFLERAHADQVGLDVVLPTGNVASRVLPVRIHELDEPDKARFEEATGNVLRSIDFIYKAPGVNRPLRSKDDDIKEIHHALFYRDQVNKVANSISGIIQAIRQSLGPTGKPNHGPSCAVFQKNLDPTEIQNSENPDGKETIVKKRSFAKVTNEPVPSRSKQLRRIVVVLVGVSTIIFLSIWFYKRQARIRWAKNEALPEIERLVDDFEFGDLTSAYNLALKAEEYLQGNSKLDGLFRKCAVKINISTEPPGAKVFAKEYSKPESEWSFLGISPLDSLRMPIGTFRWKIEKEGYATVLAASTTLDFEAGFSNRLIKVPFNLKRVLDLKGSIPADMVRVSDPRPTPQIGDFYIDKYEVTNRKYREFVRQGGYQDKKYWKHPVVKNGKSLTWEEAMEEFVDLTGRPGPASWEAGDYPEGEDELPVTGVSWYEAAAYAEFMGKSLPTSVHWNLARGAYTPLMNIAQFGVVEVLRLSNLDGKGIVEVGNHTGMTAWGAFDLAGNVREWCWNEIKEARLTRGGAWSDPIYTFSQLQAAAPLSRAAEIGFRCVKYLNPINIPDGVFQPIVLKAQTDFYQQKPVEDMIFSVYKEQFTYDKSDLEARIEGLLETSEGWRREKITFNAAYGNERMMAYLFVPSSASPPYQTVVYFPSSGAAYGSTSSEINRSYEFSFFSHLLKSCRAVMLPVYKGTYERGGGIVPPYHGGDGTRMFTEYLGQLVRDFSRSIDYLETREDIDSKKIAFYGVSWGAWLGSIIPAVEDRVIASVLVSGGLKGFGRPESNEINYVTRIKTPTLMLNGKYDVNFPIETSAKPMFDLLGTPAEHKQLLVFEASHLPPKKETVKESLSWLDRYLGKVTFK